MRKVGDLLIMFYDERTIYVKHHYGTTCYNRWWVRERGFATKKWGRFRDELARKKKCLTWGQINALAERYEINIEAGVMPDVKDEEVKWLK